MELRRRVIAERHRRGLTQAELARGSGICQATISRLETGNVRELRPTHLVGLADFLGVPADYLLGRTDKVEAEEVLPIDKAGRNLVDTYIRLSARSRKQLLAFSQFLAAEDSISMVRS